MAPELALHRGEALRVHQRLHPVPHLLKLPHPIQSALVAVGEFVPEGAPALHPVGPGEVVKPEQVHLRTGFRIVEARRQRLGILADRVAPAPGAVETDPPGIGLVVIRGGPVGPHPLGRVPGPRAVVVPPGEDVVEPERHHVIDRRLPALEHHPPDGAEEPFLPLPRFSPRPFLPQGGEGEAEPLVGDVLRPERVVPRQAPEGVPVGLGEIVPAPVGVEADIGHPGDGRVLLPEEGAVGRARDRAPRPRPVGVAPQELLPHRPEEDQVNGMPEVLLGDLQLGHHRRLLHGAEEGVERLARLEIYGAVLHLDDDVRAEAAVERHEFGISLPGAVPVPGVVDEGAPHDDAAVRGEHVGQHVGPLGVGAPEILRPRLPFAVGLDQQSAEIGDPAVDFRHPLPPPRHHMFVERVGGGELAQLGGGGELDREVDPDPPGAQHVGNGLHPLEVGVREHLRGRVHVVDHRAVDPDRGVGPTVFGPELPVPLRDGQRLPSAAPEDGAAAVPPLHAAVRVVPVVEDAALVSGVRHPLPGRPPGPLPAEQVVDAVEEPQPGMRRYPGRGQPVAVPPDLRSGPESEGDGGPRLPQPPPPQFGAGKLDGGRLPFCDHVYRVGPPRAQPELAPGLRPGRNERHPEHQRADRRSHDHVIPFRAPIL